MGRLKRTLLSCALAAPFFVTAAPAHADPISAAIVGAIGLTGTAAAVTSFVITTTLTFAASAIGAALFGPKQTAASQERQASVVSLQIGEQPRELVIGRACTGGSLLWAFNFGGTYGTDWECLVIALADHELDAIEGYYVSDQYYAYAADGGQAAFSNALDLEFINGGPSPDPLPTRFTSHTDWDADGRLNGVAHIWVAYKYDDKIWSQGRPSLKFVVRGKKLYDPRKDSTVAGGSGAHRWSDRTTWEWSRNAAVARYNWVRGLFALDQVDQPAQLLVGRGLSAVEAPPERVIAAANLCDEDVALKAGGTEKRYCADGVIRADETFEAVEEKFAAAMAGVVLQPEGGVDVEPGHAKATVAEITDADLVAGVAVTFSRFLPDDQRLNTVVPRYVEPEQIWADHAAPVRRSIADINTDGGAEEETLSLELVTSGTQAQRCGEIKRRLNRLERRAGIPLGPRFSGLEDGDWIGWTSDRYHQGGRVVYRIDTWSQGQDWRMGLSLREIASSAYAWTASSDEYVPGVPPPPEPPAPGALTLSGVSITPVTLTGLRGVGTPALRATYTIPLDPAINAIRLEVRRAGEAEVAPTELSTPEAIAGGVLYATNGVASGAQLEARLVPRGDPSRAFVATAWTAVTATDLNANSPLGANVLVNSTFYKGATYWTPGPGNTGLPVDFGFNYSSGVYAAPGINELYVHIVGTPPAGSTFTVQPDATVSEMHCGQGDRVYIAGKAAYHRCGGLLLQANWKDAAENYLGSTVVMTGPASGSGAPGDYGGQNASNFADLYGFADVPPDGTYSAPVRKVRWTIIPTCTGGADPFVFLIEPMCCRVSPGQTARPPYHPGPSDPLADITAQNVAAGIAGQGAFATLSQALWATQVTGAGKPEDYANKSVVYRQTTAPTGASLNDIWVQLNSGGFALAIYAWNGSTWIKGGDPTGDNIAAGIAYQGALATQSGIVWGGGQLTGRPGNLAGLTGSEGIDNALVPIGANSVIDSDFKRGALFWQSYANNTGLPGVVGANLLGSPNWFSALQNVLYFSLSGTPAAGTIADVGPVQLSLLPTRGGDRLYAAVPTAHHRCGAEIYLAYYDINGANLGYAEPFGTASVAFGGVGEGGASGAENFADLYMFADVPPDGTYSAPVRFAQLVLRMNCPGGQPNPYLFWEKPIFARVNPGQTARPPYTTGRPDPLSDVTNDHTAAAIVGQSPFATTTRSIATLQRMDDSGLIVNGFGLPYGVQTGYSVIFDGAPVLSSPSASELDIASTTIRFVGGVSIGPLPSATFMGLSASTTYIAAWNTIDFVQGINLNDSNVFLADPAKFIVYGTQQTKNTSGSFTPPAYTGGGGRGGCPAPHLPVLMANATLDGPGEMKAAGDVRPDEWVWTQHETTFDWMAARVTRAEPIVAPRWRLERDGCAPWDGSGPHRFASAERGWRELTSLQMGEELISLDPAPVGSVEPLDVGPVIVFTVEEAATLIVGGILSHNIKPLGGGG